MAELTAIRSGVVTPSISISPNMDPEAHTDDELPSFSTESSPVIIPRELQEVDSTEQEQVAAVMPAPDALGLRVVDEATKKTQ